MKKFVAWCMVLAVGVFVMGCSDTDKKVEKTKEVKKETTTTEETKDKK